MSQLLYHFCDNISIIIKQIKKLFVNQYYKINIKLHYENIKDVIQAIEKMDIKDFLTTFEEEGGTFEFASPNGALDIKQAEYEGYESALRATWLPNK